MKRWTVWLWVLCASVALAQTASKELTIEAIFAEGGITGRGPETIRWSPDSSRVSFVQRDDSGEHGALYCVDAATGQKAVLVTEQKLGTLAPPMSRIRDEREKERIQRYSVAGYQWAPDSRHLLFDSQGQLWLYNIEDGGAVQVTASPDASSDPKFSPDGKRLAYIRNHNLWVRPITGDAKKEKQLTKDSDKNILNGEVDWVYAEELGVRSHYFWSPNSKQILFLQMNEQRVPTYPIVDWIPTHPRVEEEKYPKAGDPNPEVRLGVIDANGGKVKWIKLPGQESHEYIPRFGWINDKTIYVETLNRAQNRLDLYFVEMASGEARLILSEQSDTWVEVNDGFQVLPSGDRFTWISWRDGHTHLYLYSFPKEHPLATEARLERQLTKGNFEIFGVAGVDEKAGAVYVVANADDPLDRQIYAVKLDGSGMARLSKEDGSHNPIFSPKNDYYTDAFSALMTVPRLSLCKVGGECSLVWQARDVGEYKLTAPSVVRYKAADGKTTLYGILYLPPNVPAGQKIPLILNPYGGPGVQNVRNVWGGTTALFNQVLLRRGFAVLTVDNRGMAGRGKAFAATAMKQFGPTELADQLSALKQALEANPQLDANRVGFWGWSYGGYLTLYAMTHSEQFKAGVSVAPVTNWCYYDSIYTERYLGLPKDNEQGYRDSSPVNSADKLHGRLLIVHGTSDDNVHLQNTIHVLQSFIDKGVQFDLMLYPRKTHSIAGPAARSHLFHRIQEHFEEYLMGRQ